MRYDWNDFVGQTIDRKYVLGRSGREENDTAIYLTAHPQAPTGAIIRLLPSDLSGTEAQERIWHNNQRLSHPNLLTLLDIGSGQLDGVDFAYVVTEQPEESVADVLPDRALQGGEARQILEAIVPALRYLHEQGFVHRAVVPASIVAVGDTVKLTTDSVTPSTLR